jgi:hypothetical protein
MPRESRSVLTCAESARFSGASPGAAPLSKGTCTKSVYVSHAVRTWALRTGLGAWARGGAASHFPLVGPVAVDVATDAAVSAQSLPVLAPKTRAKGQFGLCVCVNMYLPVCGLGVHEAVGVDNRGDVEVELVYNRLDARVGSGLGEELPRKVFGGHAGDPLSCVDVAMDNHSRPGTAASGAPNLDTRECATLDGSAKGEDGRVAGVASLEVSQELEMVGVRVIRREPGLRWNWTGSVSCMKWKVDGIIPA